MVNETQNGAEFEFIHPRQRRKIRGIVSHYTPNEYPRLKYLRATFIVTTSRGTRYECLQNTAGVVDQVLR